MITTKLKVTETDKVELLSKLEYTKKQDVLSDKRKAHYKLFHDGRKHFVRQDFEFIFKSLESKYKKKMLADKESKIFKMFAFFIPELKTKVSKKETVMQNTIADFKKVEPVKVSKPTLKETFVDVDRVYTKEKNSSKEEMQSIKKWMESLASNTKRPAKRVKPELKVVEPKKVDVETNQFFNANYKTVLTDAVKALNKSFKTANAEDKQLIMNTINSSKQVLEGMKILKRKKIVSIYLGN